MAKAEQLQSVSDKQKTLADLLDKYKSALVKAAPKWFNTERALMVARLAYSRQPHLLECTPLSIVACAAYASQLGLELCGAGGVHPVPFWNKQRGVMEAQPITDYRGLITLVRRSGLISTFEAHVVHQGDLFKYEFGSKGFLRHVPVDDQRGAMTHVYAIARLKDGAYEFRVWTWAECDAHRDRFSKAAKSGPWVTDFEAMCEKTAARDLCSWLPMSVDLHQGLAREEKIEAGGEPEDLAGVLGLDLPVGGEVAPPTTKLDKLTRTLKQEPPAPPASGVEGEEADKAAGTRGGSGEEARHPLGGDMGPTETAPKAQVPSDALPGPALPPAPTPTVAHRVIEEITVLLRSLKVKPEEEQFLWDTYGKGQSPMPVAALVAMRDFLQTTADKRHDRPRS